LHIATNLTLHERQIVPIERRHVAGFREVLDGVARERRYLAFLEAPPMPRVPRFVLNHLRNGIAQFVAVDGRRVVGWCDVTPKTHETLRHSGVLGMGVAASHRGQGVGLRCCARRSRRVARGPHARRALVRADNRPRSRSTERHGFELEGRLRELPDRGRRSARRAADGEARNRGHSPTRGNRHELTRQGP
jgi:GNAT superfamily N-acetyltransferase